MTLTTHAVVGGAVASLFPSHPVIAFLAGFFSHFVLDAIPHWQYKLRSVYTDPDKAMTSGKVKFDKNFGLDLLSVGADALLGILIVLLVWHPASAAELWILALGVFGALLPDFLQFVYARFPHQPMVLIQKFHELMHTEQEHYKSPTVGMLLQIVVMIVATVLVKYMIRF